ncbi:MAG TPA: DUF302 domain-containing protein [bacterium]|jgi:uncharacterized protein (DUF302 family)|nr:DUF302 domain-containing protein [bacterium]
MQTRYAFGTKVALPYQEAVRRTTELLKEEGFGVLTEIDVRKTMREKLNADFRPYVILGACNPHLAHRAFQAELGIGLLLPCNVIVYEEGDGSVVSVMDPRAALEIAGNDALRPIAEDARARLDRVIQKLATM